MQRTFTTNREDQRATSLRCAALDQKRAVTPAHVARWPGKLWAVEIVDPITDGDLKAADQVGLSADAGYTRAIAVKILHAVTVATLFGPHGDQVCVVIEAAAALTVAQAMRLGEAGTEMPTLKWSDLRYGLSGQLEDHDGETAQA